MPRDDELPFDPKKESLRQLLAHGRRYRDDEPRLAMVMQEIRQREHSQFKAEVRALQWRWEHLVRELNSTTWPDTAIRDEEDAFTGEYFDCGAEGMLSFFGYHVGVAKGLVKPARERILRYVFNGRLPLVNDEEYTRSWGEPGSAKRLKKLFMTLTNFARQAQARDNPNYADAISEWQADLRYLHRLYFRPYGNEEHDWEWPEE
jgi:hypothetical protein